LRGKSNEDSARSSRDEIDRLQRIVERPECPSRLPRHEQ